VGRRAIGKEEEGGGAAGFDIATDMRQDRKETGKGQRRRRRWWWSWWWRRRRKRKES